jgi:hypothetical protein
MQPAIWKPPLELNVQEEPVLGRIRRAKLRERVVVERALAHVGQRQERSARYRGLRINLFNLRRCAVVHNVHVQARSQISQADLQEVA